MHRDEAGKLRGDLQWFFSACAGHAGRYAGPLLARLQRASEPGIQPEELLVLQCLFRMVQSSIPRSISLLPVAKHFLRIYTDASFEDGVLHLGWVIFFPDDRSTIGGTCVVSDAVVAEWKPRKQQIFVGESLAVLLLPLLFAPLFENTDVLWFLDNVGAVTSAVSGSSSAGAVHEISQYASSLRFEHRTNAYFEWVDSLSNPSDGLSREGLKCPWTLAQGWQLSEHEFPAAASRRVLQDLLLHIA